MGTLSGEVEWVLGQVGWGGYFVRWGGVGTWSCGLGWVLLSGGMKWILGQVGWTGYFVWWGRAVFEFKGFQVVVQRASRFDFSVARKNFDLPVFISKFR